MHLVCKSRHSPGYCIISLLHTSLYLFITYTPGLSFNFSYTLLQRMQWSYSHGVCKILLQGFENLDLIKSPSCWQHWRAVKYPSACPDPVILTGTCLDTGLYSQILCATRGIAHPSHQGSGHAQEAPRGSQLIRFSFLTVDGLSRSGSGTFTALCDKGFCQPRAVLLLHQGSSTLSRGSCCTSFIISAVLCFGDFSVNASDGGNVKRRAFLLAKAQMSLAVWSQEMWQDHGPGRIMETYVTGGKLVNLCVSYCCS